MIRPHAWIVSLMIILTASALAAQPPGGQGKVRVKLQIFRIMTNISGDVSLTDDLWAGIDGPKLETKKAFAFFTKAQLNLNQHKLVISDGEWQWNGKQLPFGSNKAEEAGLGKDVIVIGQPVVEAHFDEPFAISIEAAQKFEYFVPKADKLFEIKTVQIPVGLSIKAMPKSGPENRILLENLTINSRTVNARKPVDGTTLNVGEPVVTNKEYQATINLKPATDYGFELFTQEGNLLFRLRVENVDSPPATAQAGAAPLVAPTPPSNKQDGASR
jgi:hypothetical protein